MQYPVAGNREKMYSVIVHINAPLDWTSYFEFFFLFRTFKQTPEADDHHEQKFELQARGAPRISGVNAIKILSFKFHAVEKKLKCLIADKSYLAL
jgi:hypothetical protein